MTGRPRQAPLYVLPHGIEVIGEYAPNRKFPYWRVRVRPHPLIVGKVIHGGIYVKRSKAVATSKLGRIIGPEEHVHHGDGRENDVPEHLEVLSAADHNRHHKIGAKHTQDAKNRIAASVRRAYEEGKKTPVRMLGEAQSQAKLNDEKVREIRSSGESASALARQFGVSKQVVLSVRHLKTWKHVI